MDIPPGSSYTGTDSFEPWMVEVAKAMCRLGATDFEVYVELGISKPTFYKWRWKHPEFAAAIDTGKKFADERVERALYARAVGYDFHSEKIVTVSDGAGEGSHIERVPIVEHLPPDYKAMELWVTNRMSDKWQRKVVQEHNGTMKFETIQRDTKDLTA